MSPSMSVNSLRNNLSNPGRVYLWEVLFPSPLEGDTETLLLRAQTTEMPERSFGSILIPYKQTAGIKYPGKLTYPHTWDITFVEGEDRAIIQTFYDWCNRVIDDKTGVGDLVVKTDIYLHLIDTNGNVSKKIKMSGCYPERMGNVSMDYNSEEEMKFTITFSYDVWTMAD